MTLNKYTEITKYFNALFALQNVKDNTELKDKALKLKLELNGIYTEVESLNYMEIENVDTSMEGIHQALNSYKINLLELFDHLDKNNADVFMLMESLRSSGMKAVELAVEKIAALINNETKIKKEEKMNTENNTNAAADKIKEEIANEVKGGEAEKASESSKCNCEEGITFPLWAGVAALVGVVGVSAYAGYRYGYNKGQDECSVIIINNGGNE